MPGRVDLGDDRDEAIRGVGSQSGEVVVAVEGLRAGGRLAQGDAPGLVVGQVQVQHVELVQRQQVDYPPDLLDGEERAGHVERQAAPGVPRRVEDPRAWQADLACTSLICASGRRRRDQLEQRGQAAREAGRFRRAHEDLPGVDHQRVAFAGRVAAGRREAGRRGEPRQLVRGRELDRDGRFTRYRAAAHRRQTQAGAPGDVRAESADDRRDPGVGGRDHRARTDGEPRPGPGLEPRRSRDDGMVHRQGQASSARPGSD